MYDELVKSLCDMSKMGTKYGMAVVKMREAADAIEELRQTAAHYEQTAKDYWKEACDYKAEIPRWNPVTDRLPEEKKAHYLCYLDDDSIAVCYWSNANLHGSQWEWHNPNWKEVIYWMPLPEPPKEESA